MAYYYRRYPEHMPHCETLIAATWQQSRYVHPRVDIAQLAHWLTDNTSGRPSGDRVSEQSIHGEFESESEPPSTCSSTTRRRVRRYSSGVVQNVSARYNNSQLVTNFRFTFFASHMHCQKKIVKTTLQVLI